MVASRMRPGVTRGALAERIAQLRALQQGGGGARQLGGPVPGLPGMRFSPDISTAMQKAAASSAQFHSGNINQMLAHPAVGWSRGMAGIGQDAMNSILPRLAEAGIVRRPDGSWTITGRPTVDSAAAGTPQPGLGGVPSSRPSVLQSRVSEITPATVTQGGVSGVPPSGAVPPGRTQTTIPSSTPPATQPTQGGLRPTTTLPSQAQPGGLLGSAPPGAVAPGATQTTVPAGGDATLRPQDSAPTTYPAPGSPTSGAIPPPIVTKNADGTTTSTQMTPNNAARNAAVNQPPLTASDTGMGMGAMGYASPQSQLGQQYQQYQSDTPTPSPGLGGVSTNTQPAPPPGQVPQTPGATQTTTAPGQGTEVSGPPVQQQPAPTPAPAPAPTPAPAPAPPPQAAPPATPPASGPATTPVVPAGSLPGNTTPSRPGVPSALFPPGFPFNDRPGGMASVGQSRTPRDLSSLGASIADIVQNRVAGGGRDVTSPVSGGLSGLGDRIRAAVEGARGEASPVTPGAGGPALGPATTSIMDSVRNQLARSTVAQQAGPAPSAPNIGTMPTTPGGAAPLTQTAGYAAPGTNQAMGYATPGQPVGDPQGIVQAPLQMGNAQGMDWSSVNQWDAEIAAAVAKYPEVDPAMIKAAMAMESLGNPQAKNPASSSFGVLQIQPEWHRESARQMGLTLSADGGTPADDIMYWTALMAGKAPGQQVQGATPLDRYINNYQQPPGYRADVESLMAEINGAAPPPQQAPPQGEAAGIPPGSVGGLLGQSGGITPGPQVTPPPPQNTAPPPQNPNYPVGGMLGGVIPIPPGGQNPGSGVIAPNGGFTLPPAGAVIQVSGDPNAQQIVDIARLYVDIVPYESLDVWNGNPGAGVDPRDPAQHGWDCSGMVYWMDQNYGTGQIPEGSHEQYNFFDQTDPNFHSRDAAVTAGDYSSLNVGDIVYMDTDGTVRGGNEASHVAVYIGNGQFINAANPSEGTTIWDGLNGYRVLGVATYWPQGGSAAPTSSGYTAQPASSYSTQPAPSPGLGGGGYITGGQYVAPAPQQALPPPSAYQSSGGAPATTGQVTTDSSGRQYETMADGTQRLIYDPSW